MDLPSQVTLPKMEAGGLDVAWFVVYTGQGPLTEEGYAAAYENAIDKFDAIHRLVERSTRPTASNSPSTPTTCAGSPPPASWSP